MANQPDEKQSYLFAIIVSNIGFWSAILFLPPFGAFGGAVAAGLMAGVGALLGHLIDKAVAKCKAAGHQEGEGE